MMNFRLDHHHWTFESNETLLLGIQIFGRRGFEGNYQLAKTPFTSLRDWMVNSQKRACRDGQKETIYVDGDSFLVTNRRGITHLVPDQTHKANLISYGARYRAWPLHESFVNCWSTAR